jgi:fructosamine-3-kinase
MENILQKIIPNLKKWHYVSGGDINRTIHATNDKSDYFIKLNASCSDDFFSCELSGLKFLKKNSEFRIPEVFAASKTDGTFYLMMEYIKPGRRTPEYYEAFGYKLARMHRQKGTLFGYSENNYVGNLRQNNTFHDTWAEFYVKNRIMPFDHLLQNPTEENYNKIRQIIHKKTAHVFPSPLHGDLWSGNHIPDENNMPVLIDPSVYFGDRTIDIAMLELFGKPHPEFYCAYFSVFPKDDHWNFRLRLSTLYPLLVHARLFGGHYKDAARELFAELLHWNEGD